MPELDEKDKAVIDPESVKAFEDATDDGDPPSDPPQDPPADDPPADDPPADDPPADPPHTRRMAINGVMQDVPVAIADQIESERERLEQERQRLAQEREMPADPPKNPNGDDGFDEKFWANPREAIQDVVSQEREKITSELTEKQRKEKEQEKFWSDFYGRYAELKEDSDIVEMVLNRDWGELSRLDVGSAMDELAKRAAERIGKTLKSRHRHRTATEPASPPSTPPKKPSEEEEEGGGYNSLTGLLKHRRAKRQQAG